MKELIKIFAGGEVTNFLRQPFPLVVLLGSPAMERLRKLCNCLEEKLTGQGLSRELNKLYTNVLACIIDMKDDEGARLKY